MCKDEQGILKRKAKMSSARIVADMQEVAGNRYMNHIEYELNMRENKAATESLVQIARFGTPNAPMHIMRKYALQVMARSDKVSQRLKHNADCFKHSYNKLVSLKNQQSLNSEERTRIEAQLNVEEEYLQHLQLQLADQFQNFSSEYMMKLRKQLSAGGSDAQAVALIQRERELWIDDIKKTTVCVVADQVVNVDLLNTALNRIQPTLAFDDSSPPE
jgi:hypothetical protein